MNAGVRGEDGALKTQKKEQTLSHSLLDGAHDKVKDPNKSYAGKSWETWVLERTRQKQIFMEGLLGPGNMIGDL